MVPRNALRVALIGLGTAVAPLDTAVNIAFPAITPAFDLPVAMIQWVVICYVLTYGSLMLALGRVGDLFGYATVFRLGLAWSTLALLLCASATEFGWLLACRALQGVGAALVLSCGPALVTSLFPETRRARVLGIYIMMSAIAAALGPSLGGFLVARWGWPAVFWFRAPIALAALVLLRGLPARQAAARAPFDLVGAALFALTVATALLAINRARLLPDGDWSAVGLAVIAAISLAGFIRRELSFAQPILNLRVFRVVDFSLVNLASALLYLANFAVLLLVPYFLARLPDLTTPMAGLLLAVNPAGMIGAAPLGGWLASRFSPYRVALFGALLAAGVLRLIGSWDSAPAWWWIALTLFAQGFGVGLFQVAYTDVVAGALPRADRGVAGSLTMVTRTLGVIASATVLSLVFQAIESASGSFMAGFQGAFHLAATIATLAVFGLLRGARHSRR